MGHTDNRIWLINISSTAYLDLPTLNISCMEIQTNTLFFCRFQTIAQYLRYLKGHLERLCWYSLNGRFDKFMGNVTAGKHQPCVHWNCMAYIL